MASILTTLTDEKIAAQHRTMSRESLTWLMKRIQGLRNPYGMVRPLTKETHRYVRASDRQKFLMGGLYYFWYDPKTKKEKEVCKTIKVHKKVDGEKVPDSKKK